VREVSWLTLGGFDAIDTKKIFIVCDSFRAPACAGEITLDNPEGGESHSEEKEGRQEEGREEGEEVASRFVLVSEG